MKISVVTVDKIRNNALRQAADRYLRLLKPYCTLSETEVKPASGKLPEAEIKVREAERLIRSLPPSSFTIALDHSGKMLSSEELAELIREHGQVQGRPLAFVIGGALGLGDEVQKSAQFVWALSPLTFSHELARVILFEQLYRAFAILHNHPYHK